MADYNPNYMAAYKQYGQSMIAGGGGSNMSGTGSSSMQAFLDSQDDDKPTGLGAKPKPTTTTTKDDGPSFWERITQAFTDNEVDVTNVYQPSVDPSQVYNQDIFKIAPLASDYVYRAEMSEQTQDMVEQAMGYEPPMTSLAEQMGVMDINSYDPNTGANELNLSQILKLPDEIQRNIFREMHEGKDSLLGGSSVNTLRLVDDSAMTDEEKQQFAPLIKLADDIRNENITSSELPTVLSNNQIKDLASKAIAAGTFSRDNVEDDIFYTNLLNAINSAGPQGEPYILDQGVGEPYTLPEEEEASLMDALMEGQPTGGLMSRPSSFTGASVDVASNMPDWMAELSALEMVNAIQGINEGTVDPETGQPIQSAEDVAESNAPTREELINSVFKAEGGYSTDRQDSGNYYRGKFVGTNHGISAPVLAEHLGRAPTVAEMKALTKEEAKEIASQRYYDRFEIDTLPSDVQEIVFHAVYMGESRGVRAMQNLMGVTPDGKLGPITKAAMKNADFTKQEFRDEYLRELQFGTEGYSDPSPSWNAHGRGWTNRYNKLAK